MQSGQLKRWRGMESPYFEGRSIWTLADHPSIMIGYDKGWQVYGCAGDPDGQLIRQAGLAKQHFSTRSSLLEAIKLAFGS